MQAQYIWWLIGVLLLLGEMMLPGLTLFFFAIGAFVTGLLCLFLTETTLTVQLAVFLVFSVGSLIALRHWMKRVFRGRMFGRGDELADEFVGHTAVVIAPVEPTQPGRVEFKGAGWSAEADEAIGTNERVEIVARDGLTLRVRRRA